MDIPSDVVVGLVKTFLAWLERHLTRLRRGRFAWRRERLAAYTRFLSAMDFACAAFQEYTPLRKGLHWWNGAQRLRLLRATELDRRLLHSGQEVCQTIEVIRAIGSPEAVHAAEALLQIVADPVTRLESGDQFASLDIQAFGRCRRDLLQIIRSDEGLEAA